MTAPPVSILACLALSRQLIIALGLAVQLSPRELIVVLRLDRCPARISALYALPRLAKTLAW